MDIEAAHLSLPGAEANSTAADANGGAASTASTGSGRVRTRRTTRASSATATTAKAATATQQQPWDAIAQNPAVRKALELFPANYNLEVPKCLWRILSVQAKTVALQLPEGLLMYACMLSDVFARFTGARCVILSDVTYGACCVDDFTAEKVGADLLIHYGHSCLVPITQTSVKALYVFVEIDFSCDHLVQTVCANFGRDTRLAVLGTVQFLKAVREVRERLAAEGFARVDVPQVKPLSPGETLGCTSPQLSSDLDAFIFIADGRFHMESAMIRNPSLGAYRYDPYNKVLSLEKYDHALMQRTRRECVERAKQCTVFGVVLGTLGHQGNTGILERLQTMLRRKNKVAVTFLMAELNPVKLKMIEGIDAWIQIACPRLSIDWGLEFDQLLLTPYEAMVALEEVEWRAQYPMDYYSNEKNPWSNYA